MDQPSASAVLLSAVDDSELAGRVARDDHAAFETLMRRHNGRLFRVARAILKNEAEAEDALQDAYLDAYRHIGDFRGGAPLATWLTRIVINQALMRLRRHKRERIVVPFAERSSGGAEASSRIRRRPTWPMRTSNRRPAPCCGAKSAALLERRIDDLPVAFRTVFVMRDVEDMSVQETADCLSIPAATVRTRLFRARALLREALARDLDAVTVDVFGFAGERCDRIVAGVLARSEPPHSGGAGTSAGPSIQVPASPSRRSAVHSLPRSRP